MFSRFWIGLAAGVSLIAGTVSAEATLASFTINGQERAITQSDRIDPMASAAFAVRPEGCDAICLTPQRVSRQISTLGEREVIHFVTSAVSAGKGLLIDARTQDRRAVGFIPGSVNVPAALIDDTNPYLPKILEVLGARPAGSGFDFDGALPIVVFDDGPMTRDAAGFVTALLATGYPADKVSYYRGGMQVWSALGLSFDTP